MPPWDVFGFLWARLSFWAAHLGFIRLSRSCLGRPCGSQWLSLGTLVFYWVSLRLSLGSLDSDWADGLETAPLITPLQNHSPCYYLKNTSPCPSCLGVDLGCPEIFVVAVFTWNLAWSFHTHTHDCIAELQPGCTLQGLSDQLKLTHCYCLYMLQLCNFSSAMVTVTGNLCTLLLWFCYWV